MSLQPDDQGQDDLKKVLGDEVDPMKWLESLAARQGANPEEFVTAADMDLPDVDDDAMADEPGYVDYDPFGSNTPAATEETRDEKASRRESAASDSGPIPSDVDPLAWLESLAKRQGANPEEFVTAANIDVPQVAEDTIVDEPGYTPYEDSQKVAPKPVAKAAPVPATPEPVLQEGALSSADAAALLGLSEDELMPPAPVAEPPKAEAPAPVKAAPKPDVSDPLSGQVDPLAWLESLAKRQGAKAEELITAADLDIPEASAEAVADEPGYQDYSPFAEEDEDLEPVAEEEAAGDNMLEWLEGLAAEQGAVPVPAEAAAPEVLEPEIDEPVEEPAMEAEAPVQLDPLAGLTTEQIELKAAAGDLTPEQMEAWLRRQVESLAKFREEAEIAETAVDEEVAPAEPTELPSWLKSEAEAAAAAAPKPEPAPLVDDIVPPPAPDGLPDWLADEGVMEEEIDLAALLADEEFDTDVIAAVEAEPEQEEDAWVVALDDEFQSQQLGYLEEPDWYRKALAGEKEEEPEVTPAAPAPAAKDKLPDWLEGAEDKAAQTLGVPDWLSEPAAEKPAVPDDLDWLVEIEEQPSPVTAAAVEEPAEWLRSPQVEAAAEDDWLVDIPEQPVPGEPLPVAKSASVEQPVEKPIQKPVLTPPVPAAAGHTALRSRLEQDPQDHTTRLQLARALQKDASVKACLDQYEALIADEAMLNEVEDDLKSIIQMRPALPPARRLLGDIKMQQGKLQEALNTYRAALEQL